MTELPYRMTASFTRQVGEGASRRSGSEIAELFCFDRLVDMSAVRSSIELAVRRHPVLGSRIINHGRGFRAEWMAPQANDIVTASAATHSDREEFLERAERAFEEWSGRGFGLQDAVRLELHVRSDAELELSAVMLRVDHSICDGLSYEGLLSELRLVGVVDRGEFESPQPDDLNRVASDELTYLTSPDVACLRARWAERLPTGIPELCLVNSKRWLELSGAGGLATSGPSVDLRRRIVSLASKEKVSPFVSFASMIATALQPMIADGRFCFFVPTLGRIVPSAHEVLGNFVNLLPVVPQLPESGDAGALARAIRDELGWVLSNELLPYDVIARAVGHSGQACEKYPQRRRGIYLGTTLASDTVFSLTPIHRSHPNAVSAMFDLSAWLTLTKTYASVTIVYREDLMSRDEVIHILDRL